jgi:hypothetical protein
MVYVFRRSAGKINKVKICQLNGNVKIYKNLNMYQPTDEQKQKVQHIVTNELEK